MILSKFGRCSLLLNLKTCAKVPVSKFSNKILFKSKKRFWYTQILLTSAAFGVTFYVISKRSTICESLQINDSISNVPALKYDSAITKSRDLLHRLKDEVNIPGIVVGVSIDGETVWTEGIGYADIENRVLCSSDTVMRIASISKSITMAAVAKLWEQGKLDLDKPVQDYVPDFPAKTFDGKSVTITCRQLVSHLGGIRHYDKSIFPSSKKDEKATQRKPKNEFELPEYYIKEHYKNVKSSLNLVKDDPLIANPGSKFYYSTHGFTLLSAILEAAANEEFSTQMIKFFESLGMTNTYLDVNDDLIYNRSRNYIKGKKGELLNAPYVDNSYKWAGGGFLSTVNDLLQFGNAMLYSFQFMSPSTSKNDQMSKSEKKLNIDTRNFFSSNSPCINPAVKKNLPGYLKSETVEKLWTPVADAKKVKYGMGWFIGLETNECMFCEKKNFCVYHTGGAVGASSILYIVPQIKNENENQNQAPKGIIVVILANMQNIKNLTKTAFKIAELYNSELSY